MMDGRSPRLWYRENSAQERVITWPEEIEWGEVVKSPHIFLSRSPLTFGHSQLVVPSQGECNEEDLFNRASKIIGIAIRTFRTAFGDQRLHKEKDFSSLAEITLTAGLYQKTLVLRASAQEDSKKEYKVHLVPYFESHASLCKKRYQSLHTVIKPDQTGGLLGWLGEREDYVDTWEADATPVKPLLDEIANQHLRMPDLAKKLREL